MTDRVKGLIVALEKDMRTDDVKGLMEAIRHLRGVMGVTRSIATPEDYVNRQRVRAELAGRLWDVLKASGDD